MYVCMYVFMYVCMYVCMICMYVYMYVCMYACMHVCMHDSMSVRLYVCMYACICTCMYVQPVKIPFKTAHKMPCISAFEVVPQMYARVFADVCARVGVLSIRFYSIHSHTRSICDILIEILYKMHTCE